jgi:hypothetical protein
MPWLPLAFIAAILALTVVAIRYPYARKSFFQFLDRFMWVLLLACFISQIVNAGFLYRIEDSHIVELWVKSINPAPAPEPKHLIGGPVDFQYLDEKHIGADYSEIEPDLIEEKKTVSAERKRAASVSLQTGQATLNGEASATGTETHEYQRGDFSASRKCLELMNYTLRNNTASYFTTIEQFYAENDALYQKIKNGTNGSSKSDPFLSQIENIENDEFRAEARGFVIVDGVFHVSHAGGNLVFEEHFSESPFKVHFYFALPNEYETLAIQDGSKLRVFGSVIKELDKDGRIKLYPLAIF